MLDHILSIPTPASALRCDCGALLGRVLTNDHGRAWCRACLDEVSIADVLVALRVGERMRRRAA